ncbi:MAG: hypothetical protein AB1813_20255, partial [Verrucomicrobiota bacterium]
MTILILGGLEVSLRLAGFGYPTDFFLEAEPAGKGLLRENPKFAWRFIPQALARSPQPLLISARKPPGTIRIFVFGESAAMGDPEPAFGFPRVLQQMLEGQFPDRKFEVVNVSMTAINSHVIRYIARECAQLECDYWVIYMGNNEVTGPFGPGTVLSGKAPGRALLHASLALKSTRTGQLLQTAAEHVAARRQSRPWLGMEMFLEKQIPRDDPRLNGVYE